MKSIDFRTNGMSDFLPIGSLWLETSATALCGPYVIPRSHHCHTPKINALDVSCAIPSCWPSGPGASRCHFLKTLAVVSQRATREQNIRHLTSVRAGAAPVQLYCGWKISRAQIAPVTNSLSYILFIHARENIEPKNFVTQRLHLPSTSLYMSLFQKDNFLSTKS